MNSKRSVLAGGQRLCCSAPGIGAGGATHLSMGLERAIGPNNVSRREWFVIKQNLGLDGANCAPYPGRAADGADACVCVCRNEWRMGGRGAPICPREHLAEVTDCWS